MYIVVYALSNSLITYQLLTHLVRTQLKQILVIYHTMPQIADN